MAIRLKETMCALSIFGTSLTWAGTMGMTCGVEDVRVPCNYYGWEFGFQMLYLKPQLDSKLELTSFSDAGGAHINKLDPDWSQGFKAEAGYHFNSGNDLNVNWYYYKRSTSQKILTGTAAVPVPLTTILQPKWDAVNAEFGQKMALGPLKNLRIYAGAQYTRISTNYSATNALAGFPTDHVFMKFIGAGPRVGMDGGYAFLPSFGVNANIAGAILVGHQNFNTSTVNILDTAGGVTSGSRSIIIPEAEAKMSLRYAYTMPQGSLMFDLGYMWVNYFNAQNFKTISNYGGSGDFGLNGPFIGVKYFGYV